MYRGANGLPDPATRQTFLAGATGPVFLTQGPDGALYYADLSGGTIRRIAADNRTPTARIAANPASGDAPLTVAFDGTRLERPRGPAADLRLGPRRRRRLRRLDRRRAVVHLPDGRVVTVRLRVTRSRRPAGDRRRRRSRSAGRRSVTIAAPSAAVTWAVGDTISFSGSARTAPARRCPPRALTWALRLRHCSRDGRERLPHARDPGLRRRGVRASSSRPTTSTRPTSSCR